MFLIYIYIYYLIVVTRLAMVNSDIIIIVISNYKLLNIFIYCIVITYPTLQ